MLCQVTCKIAHFISVLCISFEKNVNKCNIINVVLFS